MSDAQSPLHVFDGKTMTYTYDNGWSFTNYFDGNIRRSTVEGRGELAEEVVVQEVAEGVYFVTWIDDEMGLLSQTFDMKTNRLWVSVPWEGRPQIWHGKLERYE